jgi:hypothetical protein
MRRAPFTALPARASILRGVNVSRASNDFFRTELLVKLREPGLH